MALSQNFCMVAVEVNYTPISARWLLRNFLAKRWLFGHTIGLFTIVLVPGQIQSDNDI